MGVAALEGEEVLACRGRVRGAEEGPAVASSGVMRRLRRRSMGVPGPRLTAPACIHQQPHLYLAYVDVRDHSLGG